MISLCWTFEELILFWQLYPPYISPEVLVSLHPLSIRGPLWTAAVCADEVGGWLFWFPGCLCSPRISYGVMASYGKELHRQFYLGIFSFGEFTAGKKSLLRESWGPNPPRFFLQVMNHPWAAGMARRKHWEIILHTSHWWIVCCLACVLGVFLCI